jgi:hypothetical protein
VHEHGFHEVSTVHAGFSIVLYLYIAFCLYLIATRTNSEGALLAFVPCLNLIPLINSSRRSLLWLLALFVPGLNLVAIAWIVMGICEARKKEPLLGLLAFIPGVNLLLWGYLAFSD